MAIFSNKTEDEKTVTEEQAVPEIKVQADGSAVVVSRGSKPVLAIPRLSEKANAMAKLNKFVFKVTGRKTNKIELRKAIEKFYDVKVADINTVAVKGKYRRYGKNYGRTSDFKKAIVTLTPDSKQPNLTEAA